MCQRLGSVGPAQQKIKLPLLDLVTDNLYRLSLIEEANSNLAYNYVFICISKTFLNSSTPENSEDVQLKKYNLIRAYQPLDLKKTW